MIDNVLNFGFATVSGTYTSSGTAITCSGSTAVLLPSGANAVWYNLTDFPNVIDDPYKEIIRVVSISGDVLTVERGQEGITASVKNIAGKTYALINTPTKQMFDSIQGEFNAVWSGISAVEVSGIDSIGSATDKAIVLWSGTDGQKVQNSLWTIDGHTLADSQGIITAKTANIGAGNTVSETYSFSVGDSNTVTGGDGVGVGSNLKVQGNYSFAQGYGSEASGSVSFAAGTSAKALHNESMALGKAIETTNTEQLALGFSNGIVLKSGNSLLALTSGSNNIGTAASPFNIIYANQFIGSGTGGGTGDYVEKSGDSMTGALYVPVLSGTTISGNTYSIEGNLSPVTSGTSLIGSADYPFSTLFVNAISGVTLGSSFTGGAITSALTPTNSGTLTLGTVALPFSGVYSNQYATTYYSQAANTGTTVINWNNGATQYLDFTTAASGTATVLISGAIAGSTYLLSTKQNTSGTVAASWDSNILWQNKLSGTFTAISGSTDMFSFLYNGSKYLGNFSNNYY